MANPRKSRGAREQQVVARSSPADVPEPPAERRIPTYEEIAVRAYHIWEANTFHDSDPLSDWLQAEEQLWYESAIRGLEQVKPRRAHHPVPDEQRQSAPSDTLSR